MKRLSLLGILAVGLTSCVARDYSTSNRADVILRIISVTGSAGGAGQDATVLFSDVASEEGAVINDNASVTLEALPKNPLFGEDLAAANDVILQSYKVEYFRSDGRNLEGVDVPYSISGPMAIQVDVGGTTVVSFTVVRQQAKLEPPLKNLAITSNAAVGWPGSGVLTTFARITIYGKTTGGKDVSVVASLEITFADFPDSNA